VTYTPAPHEHSSIVPTSSLLFSLPSLRCFFFLAVRFRQMPFAMCASVCSP
jgi:hypothetical protein